MKKVKIPVIYGDGVGPELMAAALSLLEAVGRVTGAQIQTVLSPVGANCYHQTGNALPEQSLSLIGQHSATLMGALSSKGCPPPSPMGQLRKTLDFYADIRRVVSAPGAAGAPVDIVIFRECSEDFLPDRNMFRGTGEFMPTQDVAMSMRVTTRVKCAQIARDAFAYAEANGRKKVTVAHKTTVFRMCCGMFWEEAQKEAAKHPDILCEGEAPDTLAGKLVMSPEDYDIILAASLFGDILSDVAAAKAGNMMRIINTNGKNALFYPSHGNMASLANTGRVSPMVMFYCVADLLSWLDLRDEAALLTKALDLTAGELKLDSLILTAPLTTAQVTDTVLQKIARNV